MGTEITVAIISSGASILIGCLTFLGVLIQNRRHNQSVSELIEYRITELEKKQDKHNDVISRVTSLEVTSTNLQNRVNRLEDVSGR